MNKLFSLSLWNTALNLFIKFGMLGTEGFLFGEIGPPALAKSVLKDIYCLLILMLLVLLGLETVPTKSSRAQGSYFVHLASVACEVYPSINNVHCY